LLTAVAVTVAACGGTGSSPNQPATDATSPTGEAAAAASTSILTVPLTDVRTGERFTLGGFPGKVTFFIAMAVW
jgi:hypothetical protein